MRKKKAEPARRFTDRVRAAVKLIANDAVCKAIGVKTDFGLELVRTTQLVPEIPLMIASEQSLTVAAARDELVKSLPIEKWVRESDVENIVIDVDDYGDCLYLTYEERDEIRKSAEKFADKIYAAYKREKKETEAV